MPDLTTAEAAFVAENVPDDAILTGYIAVFCWIDSETGEQRWKAAYDCDFNVSQSVGLLEMAKFDLLGVRMNTEPLD